jgi:hypothetical protein
MMPVQFPPERHMYREELAVMVYPDQGEPWVGNFERGYGFYSTYAGIHPDGSHVIVVANGRGYVIDPDTRNLVSEFGDWTVEYVFEIPELEEIVFVAELEIAAIDSNGPKWTVPVFGATDVERDGTTLRGRAYSNLADNVLEPFTLDLVGRTVTGNVLLLH